jgi:hypothetical protein
MTKKPRRHADTRPYQERAPAAHLATPQVSAKPKIGTMNLIEVRPGLFLNLEQVVSVRVLSQAEGDVYAILQLSNGDKQSLTRGEFLTITGEEPRLPMRQPHKL